MLDSKELFMLKIFEPQEGKSFKESFLATKYNRVINIFLTCSVQQDLITTSQPCGIRKHNFVLSATPRYIISKCRLGFLQV